MGLLGGYLLYTVRTCRGSNDGLRIQLPERAKLIEEHCFNPMIYAPRYQARFTIPAEDLAALQQWPPFNEIEQWQRNNTASSFTANGETEKTDLQKRSERMGDFLYADELIYADDRLQVLISTSSLHEYVVYVDQTRLVW